MTFAQKAILFLFFRLGNTFPSDLKPKLIISSKDSSILSVFTGKGYDEYASSSLDIQRIEVIKNKVLIGSRDAFYIISSNSFAQTTGNIAFDQRFEWFATDKSNCQRKHSNNDKYCSNFINIITLLDDGNLLVCGTNAQFPCCRKYEWSGLVLAGKYEDYPNEAIHLPPSQANSLVYKYSNGNLFAGFGLDSATSKKSGFVTRFSLPEPLNETLNLHHTPQYTSEEQQDQLPPMTTVQNSHPPLLRMPQFVGTMDTGEKVFFFFREEEIVGPSPQNVVVYSRVAQVCKNDVGGNRKFLHEKWTSFFKARLNCSIPGNRPFYFNEILYLSKPAFLNGRQTVFAIFATPKEAIPGYAVCAYTDYNIAKTMAGNFKEYVKSNMMWTERIPNYPKPHPAICKENSTKDNRLLKFIREHFLMSDAVEALGRQPLFISTGAKHQLTAIEAETNIPTNGTLASMLYIGTSDGKLLKVVLANNFARGVLQSSFSEEWHVFQPQSCSKAQDNSSDHENAMRIKNLVLVANSDFVLVTFPHCAISVPKKACWHYKCESTCVHSGNPYCGWKSGYCIPVTFKNRRNLKQNLFANTTNIYVCPPLADITKNNGSTHWFRIAITLVGCMVGTFVLALVAFFVVSKCRQKCYCSRKREQEHRLKTECLGQKKVLNRVQNSSLISSDDIKESTIDLTASNHQDIPSCTSHPFERSIAAQRAYPSLTDHHKEHVEDSSSFDGTVWSDDYFESDCLSLNARSAAEQCNRIPTQAGCRDEVRSPTSTRAIGVVFPIKQDFRRPTQVVRPVAVEDSFKRSGRTHSNINQNELVPQLVQSNTFGISRPLVQSKPPNHLPLHTLSKPNSNLSSKNIDHHQKDVVMVTSFISGLRESKSVKKSSFQSVEETDESFPAPPICALPANVNSSFNEAANTKYSSRSVSAGENETQMESMKQNVGYKSDYNNFLPAPTPYKIAQSSSGESQSSGFISITSISPEASNHDPHSSVGHHFNECTDKGGTESDHLPPSNHKHEVEHENIYDEVFQETEEMISDASYESINDAASLSQYVCKNIPFPSPEVCHNSEDDATDDVERKKIRLPNDKSVYKPVKNQSKSKKTIKFPSLKYHKKTKGKKCDERHRHSEEMFLSPSYDEEIELPVVEGWKEINYDLTSSSARENIDVEDNYSDVKDEFLTMRPKNRQRQQMPKMRNTDKKWITGNNPVPIPTPGVPIPTPGVPGKKKK